MAFTSIIGPITSIIANKRLKALWERQAEGVTFTVGAEAANVINVAAQLTDANGTAVAAQQVVQVFLSDSSIGTGLTASTVDTESAIGTAGSIILTDLAKTVYTVESTVAGLIDLDITHTAGAGTWYLVVVLPNGKTAVSGAITFAA